MPLFYPAVQDVEVLNFPPKDTTRQTSGTGTPIQVFRTMSDPAFKTTDIVITVGSAELVRDIWFNANVGTDATVGDRGIILWIVAPDGIGPTMGISTMGVNIAPSTIASVMMGTDIVEYSSRLDSAGGLNIQMPIPNRIWPKGFVLRFLTNNMKAGDTAEAMVYYTTVSVI